jgi:hypothetical protein
VSDIDNGGGCAYVGIEAMGEVGGTWEILFLLLSFPLNYNFCNTILFINLEILRKEILSICKF